MTDLFTLSCSMCFSGLILLVFRWSNQLASALIFAAAYYAVLLLFRYFPDDRFYGWANLPLYVSAWLALTRDRP